jgi:hypothetical protein
VVQRQRFSGRIRRFRHTVVRKEAEHLGMLFREINWVSRVEDGIEMLLEIRCKCEEQILTTAELTIIQ